MPRNIRAEKMLHQIQEEMNTAYKIKILMMLANVDNSYLLQNADGSYSLYTLGMLISSDITDISSYNIPIKEK